MDGRDEQVGGSFEVIFSGHGVFELNTDPPCVTVPDGVMIYFYSENMRVLLDSVGGEMETMSAAFQAATPSQEVHAGQTCPNYTLYPPDDLDIEQSPDEVDHFEVTAPTTMAELIESGLVVGDDVYWAACRVVELQPAGGELLGVNAYQTDFGYETGAPGDDPTASFGVGLYQDTGAVQSADDWIRGFWAADDEGRMTAFTDLPSGYKRIYSDYSPELATWARQNGFIV